MLKTLPAISVCIPCYNVEKTIVSSLGSIVNQNYPKNKIVVLLCDNNSTDKGIEIAKKYLQKNKMNFKILSEKAKGQPFARWTLWHNVKTPYFVFLDGDDWYLPNAFKDLVGGLKKDIDMVLGGRLVISQKKIEKRHYHKNACHNFVPFTTGVWSILFKTSYVKKTLSKQKYSDLHYTGWAEEIYFTIFMSVNEPKVVLIKNNVYVLNRLWNNTDSSIVIHDVSRANSIITVWKYAFKILKANNKSNPKLIKHIKKEYKKGLRFAMRKYLLNKERKVYKKLFKKNLADFLNQ